MKIRFDEAHKWLALLYIAPLFGIFGLITNWWLYHRLKNLGEPALAHSKQALRVAALVTIFDFFLLGQPMLLPQIYLTAELSAALSWAPRLFSLLILVLVLAGKDIRILVSK